MTPEGGSVSIPVLDHNTDPDGDAFKMEAPYFTGDSIVSLTGKNLSTGILS